MHWIFRATTDKMQDLFMTFQHQCPISEIFRASKNQKMNSSELFRACGNPGTQICQMSLITDIPDSSCVP